MKKSTFGKPKTTKTTGSLQPIFLNDHDLKPFSLGQQKDLAPFEAAKQKN